MTTIKPVNNELNDLVKTVLYRTIVNQISEKYSVMDGFINNLSMVFIPLLTKLAGRAQSGYIFTYAFAMVLGIVILITWMTLGTGS